MNKSHVSGEEGQTLETGAKGVLLGRAVACGVGMWGRFSTEQGGSQLAAAGDITGRGSGRAPECSLQKLLPQCPQRPCCRLGYQGSRPGMSGGCPWHRVRGQGGLRLGEWGRARRAGRVPQSITELEPPLPPTHTGVPCLPPNREMGSRNRWTLCVRRRQALCFTCMSPREPQNNPWGRSFLLSPL